MISCKRPVAPDDSFARDRILRLIFCKRPDPSDDHLQEARRRDEQRDVRDQSKVQEDLADLKIVSAKFRRKGCLCPQLVVGLVGHGSASYIWDVRTAAW